MNPRDTMTRGAALELVDSIAADLDQLRALARHWIGHDEIVELVDGTTAVPNEVTDEQLTVAAGEFAEFLRDYIDCACDCDAARDRGPRDTDNTGLQPWDPL